MIYRARAGTFFCIFFVFLARVSSGVEKYVVGLRYNFANFFDLLLSDSSSQVVVVIYIYTERLTIQINKNKHTNTHTRI